ncbi:TonB-dependent receptor domain-containing protein [Sporomusa sp. GT1]|uniref:TonB-dependent receptor domain-containing protein n=1 Tax=Sporomusa sp. GT1 TaxID=1534747 RepID=UPI00166F20B8|nr:TonB-dependent receptor [Sporomusa sp. GT1]
MKSRKKLNSKKKELLTSLVLSALLCSTPVYAGPVIIGETVNDKELGTGTGPAIYTIGAGQTKTTWINTDQTNTPALRYKAVVIEDGGIWRPMDSVGFSSGDLTIGAGAVLDMSYKYADYNYDVSGAEWKSLVRGFNNNNTTATKTVFYDGAILKGTVYGKDFKTQFTFKNPQLGTGESAATVRVQYRFDKSFFSGSNSGVPSGSWEAAQAITLQGTVTQVINLRNLTASVEPNLSFVAEIDNSYIDDALHKYLFVPTLTTNYTAGATKNYDLSWTATSTDFLSQGVFSAANAQLSMRNLWRIEDGLFWQRGEDLRAAARLGQTAGADGTWAQVWRGKYSFDGAYGSDFGQSYNGIQVGYDKQREGRLFGGRLHTGLFVSMLNSDADFHQHTKRDGTNEVLYSRGSGELTSKGIGLYTTWLGDKGHYLDLSVRGSKLSNDYQFRDSQEELFQNDYRTWAYGAGLRYGYQKQLANGWYVEPQAGLSYGTLRGHSYTAANNMRYTQDNVEMLTGRLGVTAGRNFVSGSKRGLVYAKAAVNHDFKDGGSARADALYWSSYWDDYLVGASLPVNTLAGKDTWFEFGLGANLQIGKDQNAFVGLTKTTGGKVNTDWQVNAGMSWRFNGPSVQDRTAEFDSKLTSLAAGQAAAPGQAGTTNGLTPVIDDSSGVTRFASTAPAEPDVPVAQGGQASQAVQADQPAVAEHTPEQAAIAYAASGSANNTVQITADSSDPGTYALTPLVVEAARPDWEKKLSPGTVSVIPVPEYKGEMKNLPDLLQTVPGVYVQRLNGTGHYTVARVRGSTGSQVNIYVDGVLVNSSSEAAVDLSTIPVENVSHIEVYRGYVPARFAGAPLGGAINIVTKKPAETTGSIAAGMRSFNGYTGNLELTAPAGSGSLLFALNRDQAKGDFRYDHRYSGWINGKAVTKWRKNNDYHNTDALLKWQDDNWFVKLAYKNNSTGFPQSASTNNADMVDNAKYNFQDIEKTELLVGRRQTADNLEWGWKIDSSHQVKNARQLERVGPGTMIVDNEFRNRRYNGAIDGSWKIGDNHLVEFLLDYSRETMDVDNHNMPNTWPVPAGMTGKVNQYKHFFKKHYQTDNYFLQVQDTMTLNKSGNLFFTPVLRAQKLKMDVDLGDPDIGQWNYSYGLGLKKVQNDHWTFRGTYGTYYKFPNFYEIFGDGVNVLSRYQAYNSSNTDFLLNSFVERGTSWDISANWQGRALEADTDLTLTYFNRNARNLTVYNINPIQGYAYYTNQDSGKIQGLELEGKFDWQRWNLLLATTWNDSLVTKGKNNPASQSVNYEGRPFAWIPEWEVNARLSYRFPGDKLTVFGEYHYLDKTGIYYEDIKSPDATALYDSLGLTNIGLKYDFNKAVKLTAGVNDLFDKGPNQVWRRSSDGSVGSIAYPQQGRTYYMTMRYFF